MGNQDNVEGGKTGSSVSSVLLALGISLNRKDGDEGHGGSSLVIQSGNHSQDHSQF